MNKIIPALPCSNTSALIEFYKCLGFESVGQFVRSYVIMKYEDLEFHFYGTNHVPPEANSSMCIIVTDDLEQLHDTFTNRLKAAIGKIPRSGFPKITKIRELSEDRRFTLTDPSGNTFYILTPKLNGNDTFFRDFSNQQHAENFATLYDLVYSKEDCKVANNMLPKLLSVKEELDDLDKAKLLLTALEIQVTLGVKIDDTSEIAELMKNKSDESWEKVKIRFIEITSV